MSSRCTTRKPAASHTFFPPASSRGSTGPPGAAIPIVAPGAIARGLTSRWALTLEITLVRGAAEAGALRQAELAAALVGEVAELRVLPVELELDRAGRAIALFGDDQLGEP